MPFLMKNQLLLGLKLLLGLNSKPGKLQIYVYVCVNDYKITMLITKGTAG